MASAKIQTIGAYVAFAMIILSLIALLAVAGLYIRHAFPSGPTKPAEGPPPKAAVSPLAGHYSGYTTLQSGICSLGVHEFVIDIDDGGNARSSYAMKDGKFMTGNVGPNGKIKMGYRENGVTVLFDGQVQDGHITGTSSTNSDRTCTIYWDLARN